MKTNGRPRKVPRRPRECHKGDFGPVLIIGGSEKMPGAPNLSGLAALKIGAGSVITSSPQLFFPELMRAAEKDLLTRPAKAIVIGPGWGLERPRSKRAVLTKMLGRCRDTPLVIDADALTHLSTMQKMGSLSLKRRGVPILTPHVGEAARLLSSTKASVEGDRSGAARRIAKQYGALVVLKGAQTIVTDGGKLWINSQAGNPWMATAGSGDVLAGVIAGLVAQGVEPLEAASLAVKLHAEAGDLASDGGTHPITATDIVLRE